MKKFFNVFMLFWIISLSKAQQNNPFPIQCIEEIIRSGGAHLPGNPPDGPDTEVLTPGACNRTSSYYSNSNLYLPTTSDDIIYIKLNFIFLTKPDGTGNFEQNNTEHIQFWDDVIEAMNYRLGNLGTPTSECEGYGNANLTDTKVRVIVNKIWKVDPAWDFLYTGYDPSCGNPGICATNQMLYPPASNYYYTYLDNDPTIPAGINVVFSNNGNTYNDFLNGLYSNYPDGPKDQWAASEGPNTYDFNKKLRQYWPDFFTKYLWMKNYVVGNPRWGSPTWETVRSWGISIGSNGGFLHELGHNFDLPPHYSVCGSNIMSYYVGTRDYLSNSNISQLYRMASISNVRQYFTENSFKNANINVTNNETWDLNFRLYSNVKVDNNSSLKATCKIIMAPQSRFIVKDGSNFIIEGAEIISANNSTWNGIKVEGKGFLLINPNTLIDTDHFYAYADNTPLTNGKTVIDNKSNKANKNIIQNTVIDENYRIYPNPTGDFVNIETKSKISKIEIYNLLNKSFSCKYKSNQIDVRNLPQGNYILKIYNSSGEKTIHFIKN